MWIFCNEVLTSPFGDQSNAVSGTRSYKYMPLPKGEYLIGETFLVNPPEFQKGAYKDQSGFAWFTRLHPAFSTHRTGLGIHPDGNLPGTEGCIGLKDFDTSRMYSLLTNSRGQKLLVC